MAAKFVVLALLVAAAQGSATHGGHSSFSYDVADPHTGDVKSQHETRVGDSVVGQYSLLDSDGHRRTVDYMAGPHSGFKAVVRKDPAVIAHAAPAIVAAPGLRVAHTYAPAAYAAPLAAYGTYAPHLTYAARAGPLAYAAHATPLAYRAYSAPVAYSAYAAPLSYRHFAGPLSYGAATYGTRGPYGAYGHAASYGW